jgi:hypothetical protein
MPSTERDYAAVRLPVVSSVARRRVVVTTQADTVLAVQRTVKALDRVSRDLDVFFAELEERAQPVPRMIRSPNDLVASILADRPGCDSALTA